MVNISKDIEKNLKGEVAKEFKSSPENVSTIVKSIFQSFTANDTSLGKKAETIKESYKKKFGTIYNPLVLVTATFYSARTTPEEVEGKLIEIGMDKAFVELYKNDFTKFMSYMDSPEALSAELATGSVPNQLLDFRWEMRETLFDTESDISKANMVIGEFLYLNSWTGSMKRFRCLIPTEMIDHIAREAELALSVFKEMKETYN